MAVIALKVFVLSADSWTHAAEERLIAAERREEAARQRAEADAQLLQQRLKAAESKVRVHVISHISECTLDLSCYELWPCNLT